MHVIKDKLITWSENINVPSGVDETSPSGEERVCRLSDYVFEFFYLPLITSNV